MTGSAARAPGAAGGRALGVLAEARGEELRPRQRRIQVLLEVRGVHAADEVDGVAGVLHGQTEVDAVVRDRDVGAPAVPAERLPERHGPRPQDHPSEGRVDDDPAVTELITELLDDAGVVQARPHEGEQARDAHAGLPLPAERVALPERHGRDRAGDRVNDRELPAVGDRAAGDEREPGGAGPAADDPARAVPHDARAELSELLRRVLAREHREDAELVVRHPHRLDVALEHALRDRRALDEVAAELRDDPAPRGLTDEVSRPPHTLQAERDAARGLDADDEVDGADVDPELERARRDEAAQLSAFSAASTSRRSSRDIEPWWARATSSCARSLMTRVSRSDERRSFTKSSVVRCARTSARSRGSIAVHASSPPPSASKSTTGDATSRSVGLRDPASTMSTGRRRPLSSQPTRKRPTSSSGRTAAESPTRWKSAPVRRRTRSSESARCEPRFVPATAWISPSMTCSTERSMSRARDDARMR